MPQPRARERTHISPHHGSSSQWSITVPIAVEYNSSTVNRLAPCELLHRIQKDFTYLRLPEPSSRDINDVPRECTWINLNMTCNSFEYKRLRVMECGWDQDVNHQKSVCGIKRIWQLHKHIVPHLGRQSEYIPLSCRCVSLSSDAPAVHTLKRPRIQAHAYATDSDPEFNTTDSEDPHPKRHRIKHRSESPWPDNLCYTSKSIQGSNASPNPNRGPDRDRDSEVSLVPEMLQSSSRSLSDLDTPVEFRGSPFAPVMHLRESPISPIASPSAYHPLHRLSNGSLNRERGLAQDSRTLLSSQFAFTAHPSGNASPTREYPRPEAPSAPSSATQTYDPRPNRPRLRLNSCSHSYMESSEQEQDQNHDQEGYIPGTQPQPLDLTMHACARESRLRRLLERATRQETELRRERDEARRGVEELEKALEGVKERNEVLEMRLEDVSRECRWPFVVPALVDAFLKMREWGEVTMVEGNG
ncbi:hypothetical protein K439DRAFT_1630503 [Ramaria rubella]|nr:hypothetical protein K439DRAFT_1630503 [Ramaria rubella]